MTEFSKDLLQYYDKYRRVLPWREDPKPYHVWISEIMLQQTRVDTVISFYERFLKELPTVKDLAYAEEEKLLKLWQGLGYYSRVRNMKKAALQIMEDFGGKIPESKKELIKLSGIGPYTAGAIASIAFNKKETCIDGNFLRVMSRVLAQGGDPRGKGNFKRIEEETFNRMDENRPGDFNQAMMDVGATICIPNGMPKCGICPLSIHCIAFKEGNMLDYPMKVEKKPRRIEDYTVLLIRQGDKILIEKRKKKGVLHGLWGYPMVERESLEDVLAEFKSQYGEFEMRNYKDSKHIFSHIEWRMESIIIDLPHQKVRESEEKYLDEKVWASPEEIKNLYSVPTAFKKYTADFCKGAF